MKIGRNLTLISSKLPKDGPKPCKPLIFAGNVLYWAHSELNRSAALTLTHGFPRKNIEQGRGSSAQQAVSQKTRKKSASKLSKKVAAASRSASKSRARVSAAKSSKI